VSLLFALAFLGLNGAAFVPFHVSHAQQSLGEQVWNYLLSRPFTVLTVSILLPILLLVLTNRSRLLNVFRTSQEARAREERTRSNEYASRYVDERKRLRQETIEQTVSMFEDIYASMAQLVELRPEGDWRERLTEIGVRLLSFPALSGAGLSRLYLEFPDLFQVIGQEESSAYYLIFGLARSLLRIARSALRLIAESTNPDEIRIIQDATYIILSQVRTRSSVRIVDVLQISSRMREPYDEVAAHSADSVRRYQGDDAASVMAAEIGDRLETLRELLAMMEEGQTVRNSVLPGVIGVEGEEFRRVFETLTWNKEQDPDEIEKALRVPYYALPQAVRLHAMRAQYSADYLKDLADRFSLTVLARAGQEQASHT